jgi:hypothetical protein
MQSPLKRYWLPFVGRNEKTPWASVDAAAPAYWLLFNNARSLISTDMNAIDSFDSEAGYSPRLDLAVAPFNSLLIGVHQTLSNSRRATLVFSIGPTFGSFTLTRLPTIQAAIACTA